VERWLRVDVGTSDGEWNVRFGVNDAKDVVGLRLALRYDPALLQVKEESAEWLVPGGLLVTNALEPGRVIISGALTTPLSQGPNPLVALQFIRQANAGSSTSLWITLDEMLTQLNDGAIPIAEDSLKKFDLQHPTGIKDWMLH